MLSKSSILIVVVLYRVSETFEYNYLNDFNYLLVDNSEIKSLPLESFPDNVKYIYNNANLGIAKALNIGVEYASADDYKWVITMDQDSVITNQIIDSMLDFINQYETPENLAIVSPRHVLQEGLKIKVKDEETLVSEGLYTMTSGNLLNVDVWQTLGGFNNELFIDMVDVDYYCRAMINSYKVLTLNQVYMQHELGSLTYKNILGFKLKIFNHNHIRKYYQIRNGLYVWTSYRHNIPQALNVAKFILNIVITLPFEKCKLQKLRFILKGFFDFLRNKTGPLDIK